MDRHYTRLPVPAERRPKPVTPCHSKKSIATPPGEGTGVRHRRLIPSCIPSRWAPSVYDLQWASSVVRNVLGHRPCRKLEGLFCLYGDTSLATSPLCLLVVSVHMWQCRGGVQTPPPRLWTHQQNRSIAVALSVNFGLPIVFPNLMWSCTAVTNL